jgi:hypothetical protein
MLPARCPSSLRVLIPLLAAAALVLPAAASGAVRTGAQITRGVVGYGTVHAVGDSSPSDCTSPASNPGGTGANANAGTTASCTAFSSLSYEHCETVTFTGGSSTSCGIDVEAQVVDSGGWRFDHWSGDCSGTSTTCHLPTDDTECTDGDKPPCDTQNDGPYTVVAHFVDTRAPTTTFSQAPAANSVVYSDTQSQGFTWSTNEADEAPSAACKRDGGTFSACSSGFTWSSIADGIHDFCVHNTDASGLQGGDACRHWEQETNPVAGISTHPASTTGTPDASFTYTSNKAGRSDGSTVSYMCRLDAATFAACPASGKSYTLLSNGNHTFQVEAVFTAALGGSPHTSAAASYTWTQADTTGPNVTVTSAPTDSTSTSATIEWTGDQPDQDQTFQCKLDDDPSGFQPCTSPLVLTALPVGSHALRIQGRDFLGNTGATATVTWTVESSGGAPTPPQGSSGATAGSPGAAAKKCKKKKHGRAAVAKKCKKKKRQR